MSGRRQQLRRLVQQRLVSAAEEIFSLFEEVLTEYEAEVEELRRRLQEQHRPGGDVQTITVGVDSEHSIKTEPVKVKLEETSFAIPLPSVKSEEDVPESAPSQRAGENRRDGESEGRESEGREGPGCSVDLDHSAPSNSWSEENSNDWEFVQKRLNEKEQHEVTLSQDPAARDTTWDRGLTTTAAAASNEEPLHRCDQCFKSFKTRQILKGHLKTHALQGTFPCAVCHKVYSHKNTFNQHMRLHSAQNPYCCSVCDRRFTQKGHFIEHQRIHTGEKPFSCSHCGMKFRLRNIRDRHVLRMHGGPRPHTCPVCHKGFVSRCYYVDHMRTHTGERPFRCAVCSKTYLSKESLKKHMRLHEADGEIKVAILE